MTTKLSVKEQNFVAAFLGPAKGNATDAAVSAGYGNNRRSSKVLGARLLTKVDIQRAVVQRTERKEARAILDADRRDAMLSNIAIRTEHRHPKEAISAIKELNKCTGRHSIKHMHEGRLTLEQVLAESRK